jgi:glucose/arabinose dehydrogenase
MEQAPDGSDRFAIVEQDGRILLVRKGADGAEAKEFLNIEDRQPHVSTEQGLLSLAFHPGFKTNGLFYLFYCRQNPRRTVFSEWKVSAGDPDRADTNTERILLEIPQPSDVHKGGLLSFGPMVFFTSASATAAGRTMNSAPRKTPRPCAEKSCAST